MAEIVSSFPVSSSNNQTLISSHRPRPCSLTNTQATYLFKCHPRLNFHPLSTVLHLTKSSSRVMKRAAASNSSPAEGSETGMERCESSAVHYPTVWGNYFLSHAPDHGSEEILATERQLLKDKIKKELMLTADKPQVHLRLIDAIQRLGVAYHFRDQIGESLNRIYRECGNDEENDLYHESLKFRLLRQHGFHVGSDFFKKFLDVNGDFSDDLAYDTIGILSLYEASHLRVHGENILEKALSFTSTHLRSMQSTNPFFKEAKHALSYPLQRNMIRLYARHHIACYERDPLHSAALLKFAKIDFNFYQYVHKMELKEITSWYNGINFVEKFPFARDRLVEAYFLLIGFVECLFGPEDSLKRIMIMKPFMMQSVMDDIYDEYGTIEELKALTEAFERWDKSYIDQLPDTMKLFYEVTLDVYNQVGNDLIEARMPNHVPYVLEEVKAYIRGHYKSFASREAMDTISYEEYLRSGVLAIGCSIVVATLLMTMGEEAKKEEFECLSVFPNAVRAVSTLARIMNDIQGYEADKKECRISTVSCYMRQYGVSKEDACVELYKHMEASWIDINEEILRPTNPLRKNIVLISLAIAQSANAMYDGEDGYRVVGGNMKDNIKRMFVDPINL